MWHVVKNSTGELFAVIKLTSYDGYKIAECNGFSVRFDKDGGSYNSMFSLRQAVIGLLTVSGVPNLN